MAPGAGGTDWPGGTTARASAGLADREVLIEGGPTGGTNSWTCHKADGFVGSAGRWIELIEDGVSVRRPIHVSGAFVAVRQGDRPALVRILDVDLRTIADLRI